MARFPFTKQDVDTIVNASKYVEDPNLPNMNMAYMNIPVYMADWQKYDLTFRVFGQGTSLILQGQRIRGINWKLRYHNSDCTTVCGWHEHLFDEKDKDKKVREVSLFKNDSRNISIEKIIKTSLSLWNIEIKNQLYKQIELKLKS